MRVIDVVISLLWIVFWIYWLIAAIGTRGARSLSRGYASTGPRVAVLLLILLLLLLRTNVLQGHTGVVDNPLLQGIGVGVLVLGLALAVWARLYLGRNWGTPMSEKVDPELVTAGPYRRVRHPIYSGLILAMIGTALAIGIYWLIACVLVAAYFVYSATVEERNMTRLFPATYPAYKRSTKMLIPFVV